jgi:hypothetical protein
MVRSDGRIVVQDFHWRTSFATVAQMTWAEFIAIVILGALAAVVIFIFYRSMGAGFVM